MHDIRKLLIDLQIDCDEQRESRPAILSAIDVDFIFSLLDSIDNDYDRKVINIIKMILDGGRDRLSNYVE